MSGMAPARPQFTGAGGMLPEGGRLLRVAAHEALPCKKALSAASYYDHKHFGAPGKSRPLAGITGWV